MPPIKNSESLHEVGGEVGNRREIKVLAGEQEGKERLGYEREQAHVGKNKKKV